MEKHVYSTLDLKTTKGNIVTINVFGGNRFGVSLNGEDKGVYSLSYGGDMNGKDRDKKQGCFRLIDEDREKLQEADKEADMQSMFFAYAAKSEAERTIYKKNHLNALWSEVDAARCDSDDYRVRQGLKTYETWEALYIKWDEELANNAGDTYPDNVRRKTLDEIKEMSIDELIDTVLYQVESLWPVFPANCGEAEKMYIKAKRVKEICEIVLNHLLAHHEFTFKNAQVFVGLLDIICRNTAQGRCLSLDAYNEEGEADLSTADYIGLNADGFDRSGFKNYDLANEIAKMIAKKLKVSIEDDSQDGSISLFMLTIPQA